MLRLPETRNRNHTHARRAPLAGKWQPVCREGRGDRAA